MMSDRRSRKLTATDTQISCRAAIRTTSEGPHPKLVGGFIQRRIRFSCERRYLLKLLSISRRLEWSFIKRSDQVVAKTWAEFQADQNPPEASILSSSSIRSAVLSCIAPIELSSGSSPASMSLQQSGEPHLCHSRAWNERRKIRTTTDPISGMARRCANERMFLNAVAAEMKKAARQGVPGDGEELASEGEYPG